MAQPRVILIRCLYLSKLNPVLRIGVIAKYVYRWNDGLEIAGSSPLYATFFFQQSTCLLVWDKILIFSVFVSCLSRKGQALSFTFLFWN